MLESYSAVSKILEVEEPKEEKSLELLTPPK